MTLLALLRHAETDWTASRRLQGRTDIPLSAGGRQVLAGRRVPSTWRHVRVLSSPLLRCTQTAACLGLADVRLEPRLVEMSWGTWEGCTLASLRETLGDSMRDNEALGMDFRPAGGESPREVLHRLQPWLQALGSAGQPALAISHRGVMRVVFASATGWDLCGKPPARLDWSCLQLFEVDAQGRARVLQLNVPLDLASRTVAAQPGT
ncbi:MAG: histidine phosphatase family protein [Rhodoferax sp.]|nr:histidine phosphatase family protein [Rhodoferax sp.]